jgi:hypothetical protein
MEYQKQTIQLACAGDRVVEVQAVQGVGTGLAYHPVPSQPNLYALTHVPSGFALTELTMPTEGGARMFLEKVAEFDPNRWQIGLPALKQRYNTRMRARLELAHEESLSPYEVFMYPKYADGEADPNFNMDAVEDPYNPSNLVTAIDILFYRRLRDMAERVLLVRMHKGTGKHEVLHTYTRDELMLWDAFSLVAHLLTLALTWMEWEQEQREGQFELEVDGWLATVEFDRVRVCLWDYDQDGTWEVYSFTDLASSNGGMEESIEQEMARRESGSVPSEWASQAVSRQSQGGARC